MDHENLTAAEAAELREAFAAEELHLDVEKIEAHFRTTPPEEVVRQVEAIRNIPPSGPESPTPDHGVSVDQGRLAAAPHLRRAMDEYRSE
jgi:hypothetical protein